MNNVLKKAVLRIDEPPHPTIEAIREVCQQLEVVKNRFSIENDPDLIECCIFEIEALRARYRYLLRTARQQGLSCQEKTHLWNE
ncbi:MAG: DUF2508 family protein [Clostridia bacterium]|nr:DUF2508 family protein [Clostridia bacterium]